MNCKFVRVSAKVLTVALCLGSTCGWSQKITKMERGQVLDMLQQISPEIKKRYYDPKFQGVDWNAVVDKATEKINAADSLPLATSEVGAALLSLNDSHTFFLPPPYDVRFDYGWTGRMIGDRCYVIRVRPGSDAEKKGVKPGDELLTINGYIPTRDNFWKMEYAFKTLRPQPELVLDLRDPVGQQREVQVATKTVQKQQILDATAGDAGYNIWDVIRREETEAYLGRAQFSEAGGDVGILKLPSFEFDKPKIDRMIGKARQHKSLVLDLRGNPGGYTDTLQYLIGACFDKEIKVGDRIGKSNHKPMIAKSHYHPFTGKLVVLVDSQSASAAELFARVVQIEKRGTVVGDRSSGSVMEAKQYTYKSGADTVIYFGASITEAEIVMTDGKSLEHVGVVPDEVVLPSADDLANGRDPVLAHAVETVGGKLTPEAAGKLFPYEWPKI
ncbi:MAG: S41 family peptidase [Acidobacteriaceae bacterium]